jgi:tRNA G18 (ribose-2'-O)-methylase SpoU
MEHLEGRISVLAALEARLRRFEVVLVSASAHTEKVGDLLDAAARAGVPVKRVPADELDRMSHGRTHGGVLAICTPRPPTPIEDLLQILDHCRHPQPDPPTPAPSSLPPVGLRHGAATSAPSSLPQVGPRHGTVKSEFRPTPAPPLLLLLEGIDDARNLGFVLRTADALGVHGVLVKRHVWDYDGADVSRSSSGAYERLPLVQVEDAAAALGALRKRSVAVWGCVAGAKRALHDAPLAGPVLLAIGGEKRGLSGAVRELCDGFLSIPMREGSTSLSLSHAAAILIAEAARQRGNI